MFTKYAFLGEKWDRSTFFFHEISGRKKNNNRVDGADEIIVFGLNFTQSTMYMEFSMNHAWRAINFRQNMYKLQTEDN